VTSPRIVVLTGAGISAESGLSTFRDADGIWSKVRIEDVATPEAYARNPDRVLEFYNMRRRTAREAKPNAAHHALARLEREAPGELLLVTQNIDDLHDRAGSTALIHMHGEIMRALCAACGHQWPWEGDMTREDACPRCEKRDVVRPDVVWFGEMPYQMERIFAAVAECELFVSIGTSGAVYPAAGLSMEARAAGARTLELNLEPSETVTAFEEARHGPASSLVPAWVEEILAAG